MLGDPKSIMKARKAVRKALQIQIEKNGFSFIEVLAACPSNFKLPPKQAQQWVKEVLGKNYPPGVIKDISEDFERRDFSREDVSTTKYSKILDIKDIKVDRKKIEFFKQKEVDERIRIAGFGGQGVLSLGTILSEMGMRHDYQISWLPSYGPEMRGGTANCSVKIASKKIGAPLVERPTVLIAMNRPSLDRFEADVVSGGIIIYDSSLIEEGPEREDVTVIPIPATKIADDLGISKVANSVIVGALVEKLGIMSQEIILDSLSEVMKKKKLVDINRKAIKKGVEFIRNL